MKRVIKRLKELSRARRAGLEHASAYIGKEFKDDYGKRRRRKAALKKKEKRE